MSSGMQNVLRKNPNPTCVCLNSMIYLSENRFTSIVKKKGFFFLIAESSQIVCSILVSKTQGSQSLLIQAPLRVIGETDPWDSWFKSSAVLLAIVKLYQSFYWHSFHCLLLNLFHLIKTFVPRTFPSFSSLLH